MSTPTDNQIIILSNFFPAACSFDTHSMPSSIPLTAQGMQHYWSDEIECQVFMTQQHDHTIAMCHSSRPAWSTYKLFLRYSALCWLQSSDNECTNLQINLQSTIFFIHNILLGTAWFWKMEVTCSSVKMLTTYITGNSHNFAVTFSLLWSGEKINFLYT